MKKLLLLVLLTYGVVSASDMTFSDDMGVIVYTLEADVGGGVVKVSCWDYILGATETTQAAAKMAAQSREESATDLVLGCMVSHVSGTPYFYGHMLDYVSGGYQYSVHTYYPLKGTLGDMREGAAAQFAILLPEVKRGEPFTLYLEKDSVEAVLIHLFER